MKVLSIRNIIIFVGLALLIYVLFGILLTSGSRASSLPTPLLVMVVLLILSAIFLLIFLVYFPIRKLILGMIETNSSLENFSDQLQTGSQQVSAAVTQIASGAENQSEQIKAISEILINMSTATQQMATTAASVAELSNKSSEAAQIAGEAGEKSIESLSKIQEIVSNSSAMVKNLSVQSTQIVGIVDTITNISEQTNLLALNAAIEAAHAGDAGRGFAVVADEVRKLAEDSAKSGEQIGRLVEKVQEQIQESVGAMEAGVKEVNASTAVINNTLESLKRIAIMAQDVSTKVQEISAAILEQSSSSQQIVSTIDDIASVAEQNAVGAQEISAVIQQQAISVAALLSITQEFNSITFQLQKLIGIETAFLEKHSAQSSVEKSTDSGEEKEKTEIQEGISEEKREEKEE
ncbi:hypothetical protein COS81_00065 [candidate division WWE3 bacterium CG06_land_8_20_14_3_00_42_16]|uniref:Methyl-accepting transducer domain-containing protein n=4 Tax=Katanobacteria TaxID=422282 RepID=A0A2M7APT2_UNCKA|nr:MAG: hypothetical protein AUJ38_03720 [bacterium CG1_02_42_9]PIU69392.1 MAG: hypothetical protein COS81_00065 [candidate division WWE3 bacterium CG06_land_8_20_14_3_00_42_16]PJA37095.1 MAG: hypothetical protein CO181_05020 [candidate division WWE3 bacterium CG_4_9_14_3_um_filter_43_9]PJC67963.1 MAG: hypothetical protein CO015_05775 [candidate division WWE3 bacterium CG_4_8_14_3_um_filter_42_11]